MTGKLAEAALRRQLEALAPRIGFRYSVAVLPITAVSLATTPWIARHLEPMADIDRVLLPGMCAGDLNLVAERLRKPVERGPNDLRDLPEFFGQAREKPAGYGKHDIEILAEINHAPRLTLVDILAQAREYRDAGADVIDLGCDPGDAWTGVAETVRALRAEGLRVSIDSFNGIEVAAAVRAGAELVLSVNGANLATAPSWGCEVVVLPDEPGTLDGLDASVDKLLGWGVPFRIDPILEPIGLGFAASLGRYLEVRRRYPDTPMMMGVGNLTELTDVDSAGVNVMLLGFCQEISVRSVLTTQVINWCRSCVHELHLARQLVHYAVAHRTPPKRLEPDLLILRDPKLRAHGEEVLTELAAGIADRNFRLFAERGELHAINGQMHVRGRDPFELFQAISRNAALDPTHAFYLGYELAKAATALTLGKNYEQDQALRWGFLTVPETTHRRTMMKETDERS